MNRKVISLAGAVVASGFLLASAAANYLFGASLGRTPREAALYGIVGVLAVAMNALAPFFLSWSLAASRKTTAVGIGLLWSLCLIYSTTSALGFAAQNREGVAQSRQITVDAYDDTRRELVDLETRRRAAKAKDRAQLDNRIDEIRRRLVTLRDQRPVPADAQSAFLSAITLGFIEARNVRVALVALFAIMVEVGATLGLFVALSHSLKTPSPPTPRWKPGHA